MSPQSARTATWSSLWRFVEFLATVPPPGQVVVALTRGPLAGYGARAVMLWQRVGDELVVLGQSGHTDEEAGRYAVIPLTMDYAVTRAVQRGTYEASEASRFWLEYTGASYDEVLWAGTLERLKAVSVVDSAIMGPDGAIGAWGFVSDRHWPGSDDDPDVLTALSGALSLWMQHPDVDLSPTAVRRGTAVPVAISKRQRDILRLVEKGQSNTKIAAKLGYSDSTVKQELAKTMRAMVTTDRHEAAARARALGLL